MTFPALDLTSYPKRAGARFDVLSCIDGYDVIAVDSGRPVAHRETRGAAQSECDDLNHASKGGVRSLARALGAPIKRG